MTTKPARFLVFCATICVSLVVGQAASAALIINEVLADPHPDQPPSDPNGDANGDGMRQGSEDEFIELVNDMPMPLDISGYTISDELRLRHTFPAGTVVAAGGAVVVFDGDTPTGDFGGAIVQTASTGSLGFNNGGDVITINDGMSDIATLTYPVGELTGDNQSMTRDPDISGDFVNHSTLAGIVHSPGFLNDGMTPIPEPASGTILVLGIFAMAFRRR